MSSDSHALISTPTPTPTPSVSVTINQKVGQSDPTNSLPIEFTVVCSEAINPAPFDSSDINQTGAASVNLVDNGSGVLNSASTSTDNSVTYDTSTPVTNIVEPVNGS